MKLTIVKARKPKGYVSTRLLFSNQNSAENYVNTLNNQFLLNKAKLLEYKLSKKEEKIIKFSEQKKHLLTTHGSQFLLWEEYD